MFKYFFPHLIKKNKEKEKKSVPGLLGTSLNGSTKEVPVENVSTAGWLATNMPNIVLPTIIL